MNIFLTENFKKYNTKNRTAGIGEWVDRKGVSAMDIRPEPFYQNNYNPSVVSGALMDEFSPNTQYLFDLWIDGDDVIYNGSNVACGFTTYYTDGTSNSTCVVTGGNKGFQHCKFISDSGKSISHINIYYYVNQPVYYRWDSSITPVGKVSFEKSGLILSTDIKESSIYASIDKGGLLNNNSVIEF